MNDNNNNNNNNKALFQLMQWRMKDMQALIKFSSQQKLILQDTQTA